MDEKKEAFARAVDKCAVDHLFVGQGKDFPPVKPIKKKRRKAGAQNDENWGSLSSGDRKEK